MQSAAVKLSEPVTIITIPSNFYSLKLAINCRGLDVTCLKNTKLINEEICIKAGNDSQRIYNNCLFSVFTKDKLHSFNHLQIFFFQDFVVNSFIFYQKLAGFFVSTTAAHQIAVPELNGALIIQRPEIVTSVNEPTAPSDTQSAINSIRMFFLFSL